MKFCFSRKNTLFWVSSMAISSIHKISHSHTLWFFVWKTPSLIGIYLIPNVFGQITYFIIDHHKYLNIYLVHISVTVVPVFMVNLVSWSDINENGGKRLLQLFYRKSAWMLQGSPVDCVVHYHVLTCHLEVKSLIKCLFRVCENKQIIMAYFRMWSEMLIILIRYHAVFTIQYCQY